MSASKPKKEKVKKFRCELCSVRLPYSEASYAEHMASRGHLDMKILLDHHLWPGPVESAETNAHQTKPIIYHFDPKSSTLFCRICRKTCANSTALLRHQSTIPHLKQMIRNALFAHTVLYYCEGCGDGGNPLSVARVSDHQRSKAHVAAVAASGWEEKMSDWESADAVFTSMFDWGIRELVSVGAVESALSATEFGVLEIGRKDAWDLPKDPHSETPTIEMDMMYWEHRQTEVIRHSDSDAYEEALKRLDQAKGKKVVSHCVDVLRYVLRCFPVRNKLEVLLFDPAFFKIFLLGKLSPPAFAILHRLLTRRLPTRQEGPTDLVRFSAADFVPRINTSVASSSTATQVPTQAQQERENTEPVWKRRRTSEASVDVDPRTGTIPPSPPPPPLAQTMTVKTKAPLLPTPSVAPMSPSVASVSPNSACAVWLAH